MKERYTYRWGFVFRTTDTREYTYVYRWGFVWRVLRNDISEWSSYRFHQTTQLPRWRPGAVIEVNDVLDYVAIGTAPMFIRRRS